MAVFERSSGSRHSYSTMYSDRDDPYETDALLQFAGVAASKERNNADTSHFPPSTKESRRLCLLGQLKQRVALLSLTLALVVAAACSASSVSTTTTTVSGGGASVPSSFHGALPLEARSVPYYGGAPLASASLLGVDMDALTDRWDDWKQSLGQKEKHLGREWSNESQQLASQLQDDRQRLGSTWSAKEQQMDWPDRKQTLESDLHETWENAAVKEHSWWNTTVHTEQDWQRVVSVNLHKFGALMRQWWKQSSGTAARDGSKVWKKTQQATSKDAAAVDQTTSAWWNDTTTGTTKEEQVVKRNFYTWYHHASAKERVWWNQTVAAAHHWKVKAADKEHVWWHLAKNATAKDWQVVDDEATKDWDVVEDEAVKGWNATGNEEAVWWNATERWFHTHLRTVVQNDDEMKQPLLYLNSSSAYSLLMNGYGWYDYSADFFALQSGLDAQLNQAYCAVASAAALLNSLRSSAGALNLSLPVDPIYKPYAYATQTDLLSTRCANRNVIHYNASYDGIFHTPGGINLGQTKALLECHLPRAVWQVTAVQVDATVSRDNFRKAIAGALRNKQARVLINYDRPVVGQAGGGHFSPIASYSKDQDSFLVMDVAKYKYPPVWISVGRLHAAAGTVDSCGDWNYPSGQEKLTPAQLTYQRKDDYLKGLKRLNCTSTFRGYIVVEPRKS